MPARHPETVRPSPWMPPPGSLALALLVFTAVGCTRATRNPDVSPSGTNVVDIVSRGLHFDAPDVIPAGWTTFRFRNETGGTHFVALEKMPLVEGAQKTLEDSKAEVVPVFQNIMDSLAGVPLSSPGSGLAVPEWYGGVVLTGGPGLVAPGRTAETSVYLEPGTYVIECYVKDNGVFHSMAGMIDQIVVTDETSRARSPAPAYG